MHDLEFRSSCCSSAPTWRWENWDTIWQFIEFFDCYENEWLIHNDCQMTVAIFFPLSFDAFSLRTQECSWSYTVDPITIEYDHMLFSCRFFTWPKMDFIWFTHGQILFRFLKKKVEQQVYLISVKIVFTLFIHCIPMAQKKNLFILLFVSFFSFR